LEKERFMGLKGLFVTALLVGFSGALAPGPLLAVVVTESAQGGPSAAGWLLLGHALAEVVVVAGLAAGLGRLLSRAWVAALMGLLGGLFLLWMGVDIALGVWSGAIALDLVGGGEAAGASPWLVHWTLRVGTGVLVSAGNPYWVLWWATVGAGYVTLALQRGRLALGVFYLGHILSDVVWYMVVAVVVSTGRAFLSNDVYRLIMLGCAVFLVAFSAYFLYSAARFLRRRDAPAPSVE